MRLTLSVAIAAVVAAVVAAGPALAAPGTTTANVNFRTGPGTGYSSMGTLPQGTQVDVGDCDDGGAWCAVTQGSQNGFVSGKYLQIDEDQSAWPRAFTTDSGATIIMHQPQVTSWENFTDLSALVAAEYKATKDASAVFGVIGLKGETQADHATNEVVLSDVSVTELNFSVLSRDQLADLSLEVGKLVPTEPITMSMQRLTASLAAYEQLGDVEGLKADPPPIFVSETPAVLLQTEGKAVEAPIEAVDGLSFVVNTNWDLFKVASDESYYLRDDKSWLSSKSLSGDWQPVTTLPDVMSKLPDEESWKDAHEAMPPTAFEEGKTPKVIYSDKPAELILFEGQPALEDVPGTALQWVSNSEADVFFYTTSKTWYVLFSGRWFSASSLDGPWTFATTNLPDDFRKIPDDQPYYTVRSSVPNTSESDEARLKAMIPQTARVETDGSVKPEPIAYTGDPNFEPIEGTSLSYADNTDSQVIQVGNQYYLVQDGVWFVGDSPTGPFEVATSVPDEIYEIPPSSPVYNATYVRVYETSPGAVWFGYTLGYLGAYLAWDNLVYGSGWYYPPYWGWYGPRRYPIYYPRAVTYGIGAYYNPVRGVYGRYGYAYGPYRGIGRATYYSPRTGTIVRAGGSYGPAGSRGFVAAYNPRTGNGGFVAGGHNIYGSWGAKGITGVTGGAAWARTNGGAFGTANANANRWRTSVGAAGIGAAGVGAGLSAGRRPGDNVFAGRDGNVYRNSNGQWQQRSGNTWGALKPGTGAGNVTRPATRPNVTNPVTRPNVTNPATRPSVQPRPSVQVPQTRNVPSSLRADQFGRQIGNQRVQSQRMGTRPSAPQFGGGGISRGGGSISRGGGGFSRGGGGMSRGGGGFRR